MTRYRIEMSKTVRDLVPYLPPELKRKVKAALRKPFVQALNEIASIRMVVNDPCLFDSPDGDVMKRTSAWFRPLKENSPTSFKLVNLVKNVI